MKNTFFVTLKTVNSLGKGVNKRSKYVNLNQIPQHQITLDTQPSPVTGKKRRIC